MSAVSAVLPVSASAMRSSPAYYESALPGKGCGVLAARHVCPGELLLAESPLIVVPWWVRHSMFPGKEKKDFLDRAVRELSTEQRKGFYNLHDSKVSEDEAKTIDGIWRTNNFALGPSCSRSDNGLFLNISRFNHSCVPYAEFVWNEEKRMQEIRAIRDIPEGEEITICYFTLLVAARSQKERREFLLSHYGFPCDCVACNLVGEEKKINDRERKEGGTLEKRIECLLYEFPEDSQDDNDSNKEDDLSIEFDTEAVYRDSIRGVNLSESGGEDLDPDLVDILSGVKLSYHRLRLMARLGFKLVSRLRICSSILEICGEWDLQHAGTEAATTGVRLAQHLYGVRSKLAQEWKSRLKSVENLSKQDS